MKKKTLIKAAYIAAAAMLAGTPTMPAFASTDGMTLEEQGGENVKPVSEDDSAASTEEETTSEEETAAGSIKGTVENPVINPEKSDVNTSEVTLAFDAPDGFTPDAYVEIEGDAGVYEIVATNDEGFTTDAYIPEGAYSIVGSGIVGDDGGEYPVTVSSKVSFDASSDVVSTINMTLTNYNAVVQMLSEESPALDDTAVTDTADTENAAETDTESTEANEEDNVNGVVPDVLPWRVVTGGQDGDLTFDGKSDAAYDIQVKISHSGKIGEGRFRLSMDGGSSWSPEYDLVKDYEIKLLGSDGNPVSTGLALHFNPDVDYTIDTTYSANVLKEWDVTHAGTGTGIFYAGGVPTQDYNIVVKMITDGIPGKATYEISLDGGKTYSDETVLPSNGTIDIGDDDVSIQFSDGQYVAGDTYSAKIEGVTPTDNTVPIALAVCGVAAGIVILVIAVLIAKKSKKSDFEIVK